MIEARTRTAGSPIGPLKLIVHADDFGLSESVNSGILEAHRRGIVTSASIMPTAAAVSGAIELARTEPQLDIGIHLTLVDERPILPPDAVPSLVSPDGRFPRHATVFARRYFEGKIDFREVRKELQAQIQRIKDSGVPISHLDSHQHVHVLPGVFAIVIDLAKQYGIPAVRLPRERLRAYMLKRPGSTGRIAQMVALGVLCKRARLGSIVATDYFVGFYFGGRLNLENMRTLLTSLPRSGTCELMCHPSLAESGSHHERWDYHGTEELTALTAEAMRSIIRARNIELASFRDLLRTGW